jgi:hypothetical protein
VCYLLGYNVLTCHATVCCVLCAVQHADLEMHEVEQQLLQIKRRLQPPPAPSEGA